MRFATLVSAGCLLAASGFAHGQATAAAGSVVVVPVVAATSSYSTEVIVRNPGATPITVNVKFYEANNSAVPGFHSCTPVSVAASSNVAFTLGSQCTLAGSHFGMLVLEDNATPKTNVFYAYSRAQTPGGNGFSVEGFPAGAFSGAPADVVGLKRQAASPVYQSNCFIGALDEGFSYQVLLRDANNQLLGGPIVGSLGPYENTRLFDVFALAGAPAGDHANVRANFSITSGGAPAMVPFCTVQESTFFGADFRIGKSIDALNNGQRREACIGMDDCNATTVSTTQPERITDVSLKNVYSMIIAQPDYVRCDLVGDTASLQIRLREWGDAFSSPVFPVSVPYTNGASNQTFFYIYTGGRNAVNGGTASRWFIDVAARSGAGTPPFDFGITCTSGNGTEVPWLRGVVANDFH
jgi:hypothetical protein